MNERVMREAREWGKTLLYSAVLFFALRVAVVEAYHVPTGSMRPTILEGDRILGTKFHYWFFAPKPGDVVVFRAPERVRAMNPDAGTSRLVKRVVAVEGDHVRVDHGKLFVNDVAQDEPFVQAAPAYRMRELVVPEDHVLVLGDNRNNSLDGHVWGTLPESALLAKAVVCYWPPNRLHSF
ncbi:signal peptidase I [bacterium]|nr:signal peptidase I [bacterium]